MARARGAQARVHRRRDPSGSVAVCARAKPVISLEEFVRVAASLERAQSDRTLLDVSRAREAVVGRHAGDALQRALSLACARRSRDRSGPRGWPTSHSHARVLARGRTGIRRTSTSWRSRTARTRRQCSRTRTAIDAHLARVGMPVLYTNVFWGGRSEIKPSEISPSVYESWLAQFSEER